MYVLVLAILTLLWARSYLRRQKLPPGPPRLPVIGNLHQVPEKYPWRQYQEWTKKYGPVFSLQYGLDTIIMCGTYESANELLTKRSAIYSSRPHLVMGGDCVSKGYRTLLMSNGPQYRAHHKLHGTLLKNAARYTPAQDLESKQLIYEMLSTNDFTDRYHRYASSLIFNLAYGRRMPRGDEPEVRGIDQVMENFLYAARVGTWIVDALPMLNYLPFMPWKRYGQKLHDFESKLFIDILENGKSGWSKVETDMPRKEFAYLVGEMYEAGSDTTTMALEVFTLAMILYPETQKPPEKWPEFGDDLPYIDSVVKEVLRWRPVSAGGIPHAVDKDDYYNGYLIPKGSTVIGNHWSICMDPKVFEDPCTFNPARWEKDLPLVTFGFGRRACPGQHIAKNSLWINVARLMWAFEIGGEKSEIDPYAFTQGFNSRPMPFKATFKVRSQEKKEFIEKMWRDVDKQ